MVTTKKIRKAATIVFVMAVTLTAAAHAAEKTLWKIGNFDGSSGEFKSQDINYSDPKSDPVFVVGQEQGYGNAPTAEQQEIAFLAAPV
jgi:hypothetical protein